MNYDFPQVSMPRLYGLCHYVMATLHEMFFRGEVIGQENIPATGPFILASNHASHLDPPIVGGHVPREIAAFARKTLWKPGFFGWWLTAVGCIPVDRDGGSDVTAMKRVMQVLKNGKPVILLAPCLSESFSSFPCFWPSCSAESRGNGSASFHKSWKY